MKTRKIAGMLLALFLCVLTACGKAEDTDPLNSGTSLATPSSIATEGSLSAAPQETVDKSTIPDTSEGGNSGIIASASGGSTTGGDSIGGNPTSGKVTGKTSTTGASTGTTSTGKGNMGTQTTSQSAPTDRMTSNQLYIQTSDGLTNPDVTVTIDYAKPLFVSSFKLGFTHTHYAWQNGNPAAVERVKNLLKSAGVMQNTHIMGWGPDKLLTDANGVPSNLDTALTPHINKITSLGGESILTFCTAPGWMKDGGNDWDMDKAIAVEHEDAFATLCAEIAKKYPDVKYFQVWNEMKGMWNKSLNSWDYQRYTRLYNKVYDKVKAVRPDAKIGGFYQVISNDGSKDLLGLSGKENSMPIDSKTIAGIQYFLNNAKGVDFFCIDRAVKSWKNTAKFTDVQAMQLTQVFEKVTKDVSDLLGSRSIPIMYSEFYGEYNLSVTGGATMEQFSAAQCASIYYRMIMGAAGKRDVEALLWMEDPSAQSSGDGRVIAHSIFTSTASASGGQPTTHYWVMKAYTDFFQNREQLYTTSVSSEKLEVLAGTQATLLISKTNAPQRILINGRGVILPAFGVALLPALPLN